MCVWARTGGAERIVLRLLRSLDDAYRVALGLVRHLPPAERTLQWEGRSVGLREVLFGRWDVVHTHLFLPGLLVRIRRIWDGSFRWVHTVHYQGYDHLSLGRLRRWLDHRFVFPHADVLVAVSPGVRDALSGRFPRIELVENAVDLSPPGEGPEASDTEREDGARRSRDEPGQPVSESRGPDGEPEPGPVVGTVSMLRAEKGVDDLLRALPPLLERHPGLRVRVAGDGPERAGLERTAAELGVGSAVEFCGFVDDLRSFYRSLDAYVQPSRTETFGLAVLDALRHGTPVVAARVGNLPNLLHDGRFGALVDRDGSFPERLSRSVSEVLAARDDYGRRALEGADHWRSRLRPARMVAAYRDLYEEVLRPRVCMIQPVVTHAGGGLARQLLLQSRELARRGHRVHLVQRGDPALGADPDRPARWQHLEIHPVGGRDGRGAGGSGPAARLRGASFALLAALRVWRLRRRVDVLHAHQLYSSTLAGAAASLVTGLPLVVKVTASGPLGEARQLRERLPFLPLRRLAFRRVRRVLVLSEPMARELVDLGFRRRQMRRVPNCVEVPRDPVEAPRAPEGRFRLLYAGRLATEKSLGTLLEAAGTLAGEGHAVAVDLVGAPDPDRNAEPALRERARALGGRVEVRFHGFRTDVDAFYREADAFVLPSRSEGMSNALLEALAQGLPCVVSDIPENREVVRDGRTGLVFPAGDPAALADRIARLIRDRRRGGTLSRRLSGAAREEARRRFSVGAVVDRLEDVYAEVTGAHGSRGGA